MLRTFNCGIGAIIISAPEHKEKVLKLLESEKPALIGVVKSHNEGEFYLSRTNIHESKCVMYLLSI